MGFINLFKLFTVHCTRIARSINTETLEIVFEKTTWAVIQTRGSRIRKQACWPLSNAAPPRLICLSFSLTFFQLFNFFPSSPAAAALKCLLTSENKSKNKHALVFFRPFPQKSFNLFFCICLQRFKAYLWVISFVRRSFLAQGDANSDKRFKKHLVRNQPYWSHHKEKLVVIITEHFLLLVILSI